MKLGTLLLRDAVISLAQLETALRTQVLYGGRLGTNLVELGFVEVDLLGTYLGRVLGLPVATKDQFDAATPEIIAAFDKELAELYVACPLGPDPRAPDALAVAVWDARDVAALEQLSVQCGRPISPHVAPELRLYYYLERHYGVERKARYVRAGTRRAGTESSYDERRREQPARGLVMPPAVRFEPKKKPVVQPTPMPEPSEPVRRPTPKFSADDVIAEIEAADARDAIANAIVEYTLGRFDAAVLFLLRDANAIGWRLYTASNAGSQTAIERLSLPLGGASSLQAAHDSRAPYRGHPPTAGRPIERRLWDALGIDREPGEMLVVPVSLKQRVVNLVYVHVGPSEHIDDAHVEELTRIAHAASAAYTRLIKRTKEPND